MEFISEFETKRRILKEHAAFLTRDKLKEMAGSLDLTLELVIKGDKEGLTYQLSEDELTEAIQEPGQFYDCCLYQAWKEYGFIDLTNYSFKLLIKIRALQVGRESLIEAYLVNYPYHREEEELF